MGNIVEALHTFSYVRVEESFRTTQEALECASAVVTACQVDRGLPPLEIIGEFIVPPPDGGDSRNFQTLHFDFGLPLNPKVAQDIAFYTALHVPADIESVQAVTRLVPLDALLGQHSWPPLGELVERLGQYGRTHGAWDDEQGYVEGSLARIIEAATTNCSPQLPSVKLETDFLCGMEFNELSAEIDFFERHGIQLQVIEIPLQPGELLVFDNLAVAHGRRGTRRPGELRQYVFGLSLEPTAQKELRDSVLAAFWA